VRKSNTFGRVSTEHDRLPSAKQAIVIGMSKARCAGVKLPPPPGGGKSPKISTKKPLPTRSRATLQALKREGSAAASHEAQRAKQSPQQRLSDCGAGTRVRRVETPSKIPRPSALVKRPKNTSGRFNSSSDIFENTPCPVSDLTLLFFNPIKAARKQQKR
jgi:hypothetical protein